MGAVKKLFLFIALSLPASLLAAEGAEKSLENALSISDYQDRCRHIDKYLVNNRYTVKCHNNYQHYNAYGARNHYRVGDTIREGDVQIAGYNLWLAGSLRSAYKDWTLIAKVMNRWDIVAATEILPAQGKDEENNQNVVAFLNQGPEKLRRLRRQLNSGSGNRSELKEKIERLEDDLEDAEDLYRAPGYFRLLEELRELDPSWSLILSPKGEAASPEHIQEFVGYYYRSRRVRPVENEHCQEFEEYGDGRPVACFPEFGSEFMGRDTGGVFSRRPFLASFQSGKFDFSLLSNHVVYNSPRDSREMSRILQPSFGESDYRSLGTGVNLETYARFAEAKVILEMMERLRNRYREKDVIYVGDMNLEATNQFWEGLIEENFPGGELLVKSPTTVTQSRYDSDSNPTEGRASNYDHFILDGQKTHACSGREGPRAEVFDYYSGFVADYVRQHYLIRNTSKSFGAVTVPLRRENKFGRDYRMVSGGERKMGHKVGGFKELLLDLKTVKDGEIVWDDYRFEDKLEFFKKRVFLDQLNDRNFYRVYMEILSDHFPIWMECRTDRKDDD